MGVRFKFGPLPELLPGERVLRMKDWIWASSFKSLPTYRVFVSVPPLLEAGLYVTERRILIVAYVLRLLVEEVSYWFPGKAEGSDRELVKAARIQHGHMLGSYLEIISEDAKRHWYRSRELRTRIFTRQAEGLHGVILTALNNGSQRGVSQFG